MCQEILSPPMIRPERLCLDICLYKTLQHENSSPLLQGYCAMAQILRSYVFSLQAFFKPQAKAFRYMALPHYYDNLEDSIRYFATGKYKGFPPALKQVLLQHVLRSMHEAALL